jgi:hypothetical protein
MANVTPVQAQLEAYNARDIDRFMASYTQDVVLDDGAGTRLMTGHEEVRAAYAESFERLPGVRAEVVSRVEVGDYVVDEERVLGAEQPIRAVVIYHVRDGLIDHVRLIRE